MADAVLGVKIFNVESKTKAGIVKIIPIGTDLTGGCGFRDGFAVYKVSRSDTPVIQLFTGEGAAGRSFGTSYRATSSLARAIMSEGTVGCAKSGQVAYALSNLPFIRVVDAATAKERFAIRIGDFVQGIQPETVDERGRHEIGLADNTTQYSYVSRIVGVGERHFVVQVALNSRQSLRARKDYARLDTYLVDAVSGESIFVSDALPAIAFAEGNRAIGFSNDPFPQAFVLKLNP